MILPKSQMTEEDIKLHYITPAILSGWSKNYITMETKITDGKINLRGNLVVRENPKKVDYRRHPGRPSADLFENIPYEGEDGGSVPLLHLRPL